MNSRPATSATHHAFQVGKSTFGGSRQFLTRQNGTDQTRTDSDERGQLIPYAGWVVKGGPAGSGCAWSGSGSSRVKGAVASLRDGLRPPLTREPLPTLGRAVAGRPGACPLGCAQPDPAAFAPMLRSSALAVPRGFAATFELGDIGGHALSGSVAPRALPRRRVSPARWDRGTRCIASGL